VTGGAATLVARTSSREATQDLASSLAALAQPGDVVVLAGDLGAGKTAFVQGFGRGLGVGEPITSPTFTLVQEYVGRLRVHHVDVYRLDQLSEVVDLGLAELLDDGGVVLIEWGDAILPMLPRDLLEVRLTFGESDDDRTVVLRSSGRSWVRRMASLVEAVGPWSEAPAERRSVSRASSLASSAEPADGPDAGPPGSAADPATGLDAAPPGPPEQPSPPGSPGPPEPPDGGAAC
jgi:tRNA threonylcarbamoyladenosine biosynthesis protein TsaE